MEVKRDIRFIDSYKFMASTLDKHVNNLVKEKFENVAQKHRGKQLELLLRKGVYPYDYRDCLAKLIYNMYFFASERSLLFET